MSLGNISGGKNIGFGVSMSGPSPQDRLSLTDGRLFPGNAYVSIELSLGLNLSPAAEELGSAGPHLFFQVVFFLLKSLLLRHGLKAEFDSISFGLDVDRGAVAEGTPQFCRAY